MAIDMRFFGASAASGGGDGRTITGTIGVVVSDGDLVFVHACGGQAGSGLQLPLLSDDGSGSGWVQIGDMTATSRLLRTTKWWKRMAGGETTVTLRWEAGTARSFEALICRGMGTLTEIYLIKEGTANTHFGQKDWGCNDGSGTIVTPSSNGEVYIGCAASPGPLTWILAQIAGVGTHDNNGVTGNGQNNANTVGVGTIMHINDSAAAHLTSDCLRYESNQTSLTETYDSFIGIRTPVAPARYQPSYGFGFF